VQLGSRFKVGPFDIELVTVAHSIPESNSLIIRTPHGTVLHTGDYGHLDAEGHLYFSGRRDDLFKRRGLRVSALEIEAAARDIPGVREAAVLPPAGGRDVVLFAATDLDGPRVLRELAVRLEDGKVPPVCVVRDELPLTPNGKTDKRQLAALLAAAEQED
jgi:acyl-coenzyme A synthetase/AMP-(fatty) acid ligase